MSSLKGLKTLWKKKKLLVTSNYSFSLCVFKRLIEQACKKLGLVWESVNSFTNDKIYDLIKSEVFADNKLNITQRFLFDMIENIVEKKKMLVTSTLSFSQNVFKRRFSLGSFRPGIGW